MRPREYDGPADAEDLREEFYSATRSVNAMLRVVSLSKSYKPGLFSSNVRVNAVERLTLAAEEGSVLCLLGHNGAVRVVV